jgi:hypothetical protein
MRLGRQKNQFEPQAFNRKGWKNKSFKMIGFNKYFTRFDAKIKKKPSTNETTNSRMDGNQQIFKPVIIRCQFFAWNDDFGPLP